jgi:hypothetical protein
LLQPKLKKQANSFRILKAVIWKTRGQSLSKKLSLIQKIKRTSKKEGKLRLASIVLTRTKNHIVMIPTVHLPFLYYKLFKHNQTFVFQQRAYKYFVAKYNTTWSTERAVEIPIVCQMIKESKGKILEVGNVLSHYFSFQHDIVDKFEKGEGVINEDVTTLEFKDKFDLIISISTLEHVGWDEKSPSERLNDKEKIPLAIEHLKKMLTNKGLLTFTVPLGYNPILDELIKDGKLDVQKQLFLKRISKDKWVETDLKSVKDVKFGSPYFRGNAIMVGITSSSQ